VLDLSIARAGPTAVRLLADWGADVTRVDPPSDRGSVTGRRRGSDEQNLHRNKRSVCLDLKKPQGAEVLRRLIARSDVVVENFRADVKERLGLTYEQLRRLNRASSWRASRASGRTARTATGPASTRSCRACAG
jgi:crotonobetainyl-CoA:carnitine CoA-transferase CaiB-like acyl-CoA transferase